jgi:hypothetical protein
MPGAYCSGGLWIFNASLANPGVIQLEPGSTLVVTGSLSQGSTAVILIDVGENGAGALIVGGCASLANGSIILNFTREPIDGERIEVLDSGCALPEDLAAKVQARFSDTCVEANATAMVENAKLVVVLSVKEDRCEGRDWKKLIWIMLGALAGLLLVLLTGGLILYWLHKTGRMSLFNKVWWSSDALRQMRVFKSYQKLDS